MTCCRWLGTTLFLLFCCEGTVLAQQTGVTPPQTADEAQARAHFNTGSVAFAAGNYVDALVEFQKSYAISRRPKLLYNIAVTADRLRQDADALQAFEEYLRLVPDASERAQVTGRINVLRAAAKRVASHEPSGPAESATASPEAAPVDRAAVERDPTETATIDLVATNAPPPEPRSNLGPWIALGASSVVAVTGGVLLTVAMLDRNSVTDSDVGVRLDEIEAAHDRVPTFSLVGGLLLGVGVLGAGASIAWLALSDDDDAAPVLVGVGVGTLSVGGNW